jgi:hypothetical protein
MNRFTKALGAIVLTVGLAGCGSSGGSDIASLLASPIGQAFINALGIGGTLIPGIQNVLDGIDSGISSPTAQAALQTVCTALPWADGALDTFGPAVNISATTIADVDASVKAFVAGPCTTPPTNLASAIADGAQLFLNIQNALSTNGVPVAVPPSAHMRAMQLR